MQNDMRALTTDNCAAMLIQDDHRRLAAFAIHLLSLSSRGLGTLGLQKCSAALLLSAHISLPRSAATAVSVCGGSVNPSSRCSTPLSNPRMRPKLPRSTRH